MHLKKKKVEPEFTFAAKTPSPTNPVQVDLIMRLWLIFILHWEIIIDYQINLQQEEGRISFILNTYLSMNTSKKRLLGKLKRHLLLVKTSGENISWYENLSQSILEFFDYFISVFKIKCAMNGSDFIA